MSKMSKIDHIQIRAVMLCMSKDVGDGVCVCYTTLYAEYRFYVEDVEDYKENNNK